LTHQIPRKIGESARFLRLLVPRATATLIRELAAKRNARINRFSFNRVNIALTRAALTLLEEGPTLPSIQSAFFDDIEEDQAAAWTGKWDTLQEPELDFAKRFIFTLGTCYLARLFRTNFVRYP
jgi:hypothetical protein